MPLVEKNAITTTRYFQFDLASIIIDPEFQRMFSAKTPEEYAALKESIQREGHIRDPIVVWKEKNILLDGHHRLKIGTELGIKPRMIGLSFATREDAKMWIFQNQRDRRNMNRFQQIEAALTFKPMYVAKAKVNQRAAGGAVPLKSEKPVDTYAEIAKLAGASIDSVRKAERLLQETSEEEINCLRSGEVLINSAFKKYESKKESGKPFSKPNAKSSEKTLSDKPNKKELAATTQFSEGEKYIKEILRLAKELGILFSEIKKVPHDSQELDKARLQIFNTIRNYSKRE